jgi:hypothetical protein
VFSPLIPPRGTSARELVGIARALEKLPVIDNAFSDGLLYWTAVRAMVTVAIPQDEQEWVDFARMNTVRAVERRVSSSKTGDGPREKPFGGSPTFFPHEFKASPELQRVS